MYVPEASEAEAGGLTDGSPQDLLLGALPAQTKPLTASSHCAPTTAITSPLLTISIFLKAIDVQLLLCPNLPSLYHLQ